MWPFFCKYEVVKPGKLMVLFAVIGNLSESKQISFLFKKIGGLAQ